MNAERFASIAINFAEDRAHLQAAFEHRVETRRAKAQKEREKLPFYVVQEPIVGYVWLLVSTECNDADGSWYDSVQDPQLKAAHEACKKLCMWGGSGNAITANGGCYVRFEFSATRYFLNATEPTDWVCIKEQLKGLLGEPSQRLPKEQHEAF